MRVKDTSAKMLPDYCNVFAAIQVPRQTQRCNGRNVLTSKSDLFCFSINHLSCLRQRH